LDFLTTAGGPLTVPKDWQPALVRIAVPVDRWQEVRVERQGKSLPVVLRMIDATPRIVAEWPRSGPGWYDLTLFVETERLETLRFAVKPEKISEAAFEQLLDDLEMRLPAAIALGLQGVGALTGLKLLSPAMSTRAQELQRLRRAVNGQGGRPGLAQTLVDIASDPHHVLRSNQEWVRTEWVKHPVPSKLSQALASGQNVSGSGFPLRIVDALVDHTYNTYENRLVKSFEAAVSRRLSRLARSLAKPNYTTDADAHNSGEMSGAAEETSALRKRLGRARAQAWFLDSIPELTQAPDNISMVLLNRPPYRAALEGYYDFLRSVWVHADEPALDAPLENLPYLYEVWGTLHILSALVEVAAELGFVQRGEMQLTGRDTDGLYVRIVPNGRPALVLHHPTQLIEVRVIPQRGYARSGPVKSMTFTQIPDVTVEVRPPSGPLQLYLFDPKYKLDSDQLDTSDVWPKKEDIDKMHAYRDALRGPETERVVRYAAIMYPGPSVMYPTSHGDVPEVAALSADPEDAATLDASLRRILRLALAS
jgi:hypothetical protein